MNKKTKFYIGVVAVLALAGLVVYFGQVAPQSQTTTAPNPDNSQSNAVSPSPQSQPTAPSIGSPLPLVKQPAVNSNTLTLSMVSPAGGEAWLLGTSHIIRWSSSRGYAGTAILLDAATRNVMGTIIPSVSSNQTTFSWNTGLVSLSKTDPLKKSITPGTYIVRIDFGGSRGYMESAPFQIIASGNEVTRVSNVVIQSGFFSPSRITVNRSQVIAIINSDNIKHIIKMPKTVTIASLNPGDSFLIDASMMQPGTYEIGLAENQIPKLTLTIQ